MRTVFFALAALRAGVFFAVAVLFAAVLFFATLFFAAAFGAAAFGAAAFRAVDLAAAVFAAAAFGAAVFLAAVVRVLVFFAAPAVAEAFLRAGAGSAFISTDSIGSTRPVAGRAGARRREGAVTRRSSRGALRLGGVVVPGPRRGLPVPVYSGQVYSGQV